MSERRYGIMILGVPAEMLGDCIAQSIKCGVRFETSLRGDSVLGTHAFVVSAAGDIFPAECGDRHSSVRSLKVLSVMFSVTTSDGVRTVHISSVTADATPHNFF